MIGFQVRSRRIPSNEDNDDDQVVGSIANTSQRYQRIANRLRLIEPSNYGGICSTVSTAINTHLIVLGDYIATNTTTTSSSDRQRSMSSAGFENSNIPYYYHECITEEQNNLIEDDDELEEEDEYEEPILHWFYYDEPEIPAHPALEYETGHLVVVGKSPKIRPRQCHEQSLNNGLDNDVLRLAPEVPDIPVVNMPENTPPISPDNTPDANIPDMKLSSYAFLSLTNDWTFFLALLCVVMTGSVNVISAKIQSISMYNYPIFLNLFHTFLSIPITFLLTYFQSDKWVIPKTGQTSNSDVETASITTAITDRIDAEINTREDRRPTLQFTSHGENQVSGNSEQSTAMTKLLEKEKNNIKVSRLIFLGSLDAIATTLQVVSTTFVPGSLLVLIPPAASTLLLHMLAVLKRRRKKRKSGGRGFRQKIFSFFTESPRHNQQRTKRSHTKSSLLFTVGVVLVLVGSVAFVVLPVLTKRHTPEYYCEMRMDVSNSEHRPSNSCRVCRQATTKELCLQLNGNNSTKRSRSLSLDDHKWSSFSINFGNAITHRRLTERNTAISEDLNGTDDYFNSKVVHSHQDSICQWIKFEESTKEKEFVMTIWWSFVLILSTIPMVFSSLLKQKLTRVTSSNKNVSLSIMSHHVRHHFIETSRIIRTQSNDVNTEPKNDKEMLHPILQYILDLPKYWKFWMIVVQFIVSIILIIPAYYLIRYGDIEPDYSATSASIVTDETVDDEKSILEGKYYALRTDLIMKNLWDGMLCYGMGVDSIESGCHPDTDMCSSRLAFWTVNVHLFCSCLYKVSILTVLKAMFDSVKKGDKVMNLRQGDDAVDHNVLSEGADRRPLLGNWQKDSLNKLFGDSKHRNKWFGNSKHRFLFFALVITIPVADILLWTLPLAAWQNKFLGCIYAISRQHYNSLNWSENVAGLVAIVLGLLLMDVNNLKKKSGASRSSRLFQQETFRSSDSGPSSSHSTLNDPRRSSYSASPSLLSRDHKTLLSHDTSRVDPSTSGTLFSLLRSSGASFRDSTSNSGFDILSSVNNGTDQDNELKSVVNHARRSLMQVCRIQSEMEHRDGSPTYDADTNLARSLKAHRRCQTEQSYINYPNDHTASIREKILTSDV